MENFQAVEEDLLRKSEQAQSDGDDKLGKRWSYTAKVFQELDNKEISPGDLNDHLKDLQALLNKNEVKPSEVSSYSRGVLNFVQKNYGFVTPKHYQNQYLALGMTVFGLPFGIMFGFALDNFAFFGIGLPIGMSVGIAIGSEKDKKAKAEGKQLNLESNM